MGVIYLADIPFYYDNQYSISSQVVGDFKFFTGDINFTANVIGEFTFFSGDINGSANKIGDFTFFSGDINGSAIELGGVLTGLEEERTNFINNVIVSSGVSPLTDISTVPMTIPELGNSNDLQENTL